MEKEKNKRQIKPSGRRWLIFSILATGYAVVYFHRVAPAVVAPELVKSFNIKGAALGVLSSAYFYPYAIMQLPSGLLSDSLGPRKTVTFFTLIAAGGACLFGFSPGFFSAIAGRVMVGLGVSMLFVPTLKILANWFEANKFAILTGILMAVGGLGWLSAATPLAFLTLLLGWRKTFFLIGILSFILALLVYLIVRDKPALPLTEKETKKEKEPLSSQRKNNFSLLQGIKMVFSEKSFFPLAIWFFFTGGILFGFGGLWAGPYLMQVYSLSKAQAGNILMMIAVGMIVGGPFLSYLSQKIFCARKPVLLMSSFILTCILMVFVVLVDALSIFFLYFLFFLLGIFASGIVVIGFTVAKELFPVQIAGTSTGMANLFPFAGGAFFQPIIGLILDLTSGLDNIYSPQAYRMSFIALLGAAIAAFISVYFIKETLVDF
ncbi:MFS transporter [Candidatus Aerophobetes bacterium]|nr:MFS transporter [Candidatus Aerophobetes bacterium]